MQKQLFKVIIRYNLFLLSVGAIGTYAFASEKGSQFKNFINDSKQNWTEKEAYKLPLPIAPATHIGLTALICLVGFIPHKNKQK